MKEASSPRIGRTFSIRPFRSICVHRWIREEDARAGGPLSPGGPKQRLVLAHLVLGANAVWGEDLRDDPRSTVQMYVSRLRSALGSEGIQAGAPGYLLRAEREDVDLGSRPREASHGLTRTSARRCPCWRGIAQELRDGCASPDMHPVREDHAKDHGDLASARVRHSDIGEDVREGAGLVGGHLGAPGIAGVGEVHRAVGQLTVQDGSCRRWEERQG
jgi:hypothetical protein